MFGFYSSKDVQKLVRRLREEYDAALKRQKEVVEELKEQNRNLLARVSELESERDSVSDAIVHAVAEGERIKRERSLEIENERKELMLLAEKCRLVSEKMSVDCGDEESYGAFLEKLHESLDQAEGSVDAADQEESGFNMEDVLAPKEPLNLKKLCMELGLMEDKE